MEKNWTIDEVGTFWSLRKKSWYPHEMSIQLYNKCKDYYKLNDVPTPIVYFDEVRKGKSKESVTKYLTPLSN